MKISEIVREARCMSGPKGAPRLGPVGTCKCGQCGYETPHNTGQPCVGMACPKCGGKMVRKEEAEARDAVTTTDGFGPAGYLKGVAKSLKNWLAKMPKNEEATMELESILKSVNAYRRTFGGEIPIKNRFAK